MSAKYYRFLYHPISSGVVFSASLEAEHGKDGYQLLYLGGGVKWKELEKRVDSFAGELQLLILADLQPETIACACHILERQKAVTVILPKDTNSKSVHTAFPSAGIKEICEIAESKEFVNKNFHLRFLCVGEANERTLLFYVGSLYDPAENECMMQVKTADAALACGMAVDTENLCCEMRCMLQQDITMTLCKRQNQKDGAYFVDGHFLTGTVDLSKYMLQIKEYLAVEWKKIRFTTLPSGGVKTLWDSGILESGTKNHQRYLIGTAEVDAQILKEIMVNDARQTFFCVSETCGLCISGCFMER